MLPLVVNGLVDRERTPAGLAGILVKRVKTFARYRDPPALTSMIVDGDACSHSPAKPKDR